MTNLFLFILIVCAFSKDVTDRPREVIQKGNMECLGIINTKSINVENDNNLIISNLDSGSVTASEIVTKKVTVGDFVTSTLVPNNKDGILYVILFNKDKFVFTSQGAS